MTLVRATVAQYAMGQACGENLQRSITAIREAAACHADIILLPELGTLPYFCIEENKQHFLMAENIPGPTSDMYCKLAKEHAIVIVTTLFEKTTAGVYYNTAIVIDKDGSLAGTYRKMHIPHDPGYYEGFYFTAGDQGFQPIETSIGKLGVMICYDQWFPEAARSMTLNGAELLLYPSAIGFGPNDDSAEQIRQRNAWITIQKSHAIANGVPVLFSNRIGTESAHNKNGMTTIFWGSGHIVGPFGEVLAKATVDHPQVICAEIDPEEAVNVRNIWPFLRQRQPEKYR